jgi:hypothetical protein
MLAVDGSSGRTINDSLRRSIAVEGRAHENVPRRGIDEFVVADDAESPVKQHAGYLDEAHRVGLSMQQVSCHSNRISKQHERLTRFAAISIADDNSENSA